MIKIFQFKRIFNLIIVAVILIAAFPLFAQTEISDEFKSEFVNSINTQNNSWESVNLSGKFKMKGLPLSPTLKISMKRDSLIIISIRAPFIGEAGRCEITTDSILLVNKMKKVYCNESISDLLKDFPLKISDFQNLILAKVVLPGKNENPIIEEEEIEIYQNNDEFALVPLETVTIPGFSYGYLFDNEFRPTLLMILPDYNPDMQISAAYSYLKKGYDIELEYSDGKRLLTATMELDEPMFGGVSMESLKLNSKYNKVSINNFMKSF